MTADPRLSALPLAVRAHAAWTYASLIRHVPNWGRMLDARNRIERYLTDPHPLVRRIAADLVGHQEEGRAA